MIKYLNEVVNPSWAKRIKENNPNAYAILYGWQYKNEPEVEIAPEVYMDKASLDKRLNQIVKDYSTYSQTNPRGNRYAKESDVLFYILYPGSLGESKNNTVVSSKVGYRNHEYYGANETGLDSIIRYEIGELGNSDIIDTVLDTFEVSIEEKHTLEAALDILEDEEYLGDIALDLVVKTLLNIIWKKYPNAKYGLWLCETPDTVERWYDGNKDNILTYRIENEQPISDLGFNDQGCLFVYDKPIGNYNITNQSLTEEAELNKNTKLYKLDDITRRQVQRNPLYSKYRVEVVELEPLVTQLMKNTSILGRRTDNWGDSFDKFHIKSNKAYWYNDPIRLVKLSDGEYKVLDGNHRLIALYNDGYKQVECLVKDSQTDKIEEDITNKIEYKSVSNIDKFKSYANDILGGYGEMSDSDIKKDIEEIYIDGELKGYVGFSKYADGYGSNALGIGNFMIIERGQGYGTQVIKDIVSKYKNAYDLIYCFVDSDNEGAISLYKKLGKVYDEEPSDSYYVTFYDNGKYKLEENLTEDLDTNGIIAYHGSNAKFNKFDLKYFGKTDDGMWGKGIYFISDKRVAQSFGSDYLYTCKIRLNKPYIIDMSTVGNNEDSEDSSKYYSLTNRNNDILKRKGYDSIIVKDELWEGSFTTRATEYIVFDPSDIEILDVKDLSLEESYSSNKNIDDIETPEQLMSWMKENITYELANDEYGAEDDPPTKTAEEVIETGTGHCAEQSYLEYKVLDELGYFPQLIFVKENNSEDDYGADGSAHMFVVYQDDDEKYVYFEHSQEHTRGIHKFDSMSELLDFIGKNWWRYDANSDILEVRYIDEPITGVDNWELAKACHEYPVDEVLDISNNIMEDDVPLDAKWDYNKYKILEEAYHFGNLEYGRKADKRGIMAGRGTGHFGTGFYVVGSVTDDTDYHGRELWELDLTKYNLFKPRNNNTGYTLHDTLKKLNGLFYQYKYNGYTPNMFKLKPYDLRIKLDDFEYEYGNEGIIKFIDSYFPAYREDIDREINMGRWGAAEQVAYDSIEDFEDFIDDLDFVVNQLELIFPKEIGKVESIVQSLIKDNELDDQDNIDSISTLFIKKMGYEGVDVTHLNKAEDGLSGLDNFSYGSVVYDLKPGTYRKIRDRKEK